MSFEKERKAFEKWLKEEDLFSGNDNNPDVVWAKKFMFKAWLASANRDGYKLVPVEPTIGMLENAADEHVLHGASYAGIYKAMIGAIE